MARPHHPLAMLPVIGAVICLGGVLAGGAWWLLPQWAPTLVCQQAPWVEPVARAAVTAPALRSYLELRYKAWGPSADVGMIRCLSHRDARVRDLVAETVIRIGPKQARLYPMLVDLLDHADTTVRQAAIVCLEKSAHPAALTTLIDRYWMCVEDEWSDRYLSAINGAWRGEALPRIVAALTKTGNRHDRTQAMRILASTHQPDAFDAVVTVVQQEPYPRVPLPDASLQNHAAYALCSEGGEQRLIALLGHDDARVRLIAAAAMLYHDHKRLAMAVDALLRAQQDPEVGVRAYALAALSEIDYETHADLFLRHLHSQEIPLRLAGIYPYRFDVQDPRAVPQLVALLDDPEPMVRPRVIEALCHQKDPRTIPALFTCLHGQAEQIRSRIARGLEEKPATAVIDGFLNAYATLDPVDRGYLAGELKDVLSKMTAAQRQRWDLVRAVVGPPTASASP